MENIYILVTENDNGFLLMSHFICIALIEEIKGKKCINYNTKEKKVCLFFKLEINFLKSLSHSEQFQNHENSCVSCKVNRHSLSARQGKLEGKLGLPALFLASLKFFSIPRDHSNIYQ